GPNRQNGSYTYFAEEGTLFGFRQWSLDGTNGNAFGRITNFSAQAVPEPGTLGLLAAALIAAGLATSRRRRQA
nr:PEP-CTERM sorting domain-containing protein [Rubrivivax sp.]